MSGTQYRKSNDLQKPSTGRVGMLGDMYDFNAGTARTGRLPDRAHQYGSSTSPSRADAKKTNDPSTAGKDKKRMTSLPNNNISSKKSGGIPVKMLMAQEMSKEAELKQKRPNVVARLMGLDDYLPAEQPVGSIGRENLIGSGYSKNSVGAHGSVRQQNAGLLNKVVPFELYQGHRTEMEFKDICEVWQQPSSANLSKDPFASRGSCTESQSEKRMALVRKKFIEAKRLASDQNFLQTKEFQDAVEVLSSNKDLFLKYLEEPNSLFSKQLNDLNELHIPSRTKCITVLKPSKVAELNNKKLITNQSQMDEKRGRDVKTHSHRFNFSHLKTENFLQPTRIVVLKPNSTKVDSMDTQVMPENGYSQILTQNDFGRGLRDIVKLGSKNTSKPNTHQMPESPASHRRDESLLSSIYSNGYGGDSSSFCRSDREYTEDDGGSFSDSEIVTPNSRYSWDYVNKYCSTLSVSTVNRNSPESSVMREAKKRLSERRALVAANEINEEEIILQKCSSTLSEVLAVPEVKKEAYDDSHMRAISRSCGGENELVTESILSTSCSGKDGGGENSPKSLSRSKSVPISSTTYEKLDLITEGSSSQVSKAAVSKEVPRNKKGKLSLKGKFSNFFFSRSKKTNSEKPASATLSSDIGTQSTCAVSAISNNDYFLKSVADTNISLEINHEDESESVHLQATCQDVSQKATVSVNGTWTIDDLSDKDAQGSYENVNLRLDQTSPTSVLDAPVECNKNELALHSSEPDSGQPCALSRALPIASVSRTLLSEDEHSNASNSKPLNSYEALPMANYIAQEQVAWIQKLFSSAGLDKSGMVFTGWHSLDSPLNPMLLENLLDMKEDGEKCRARRSKKRLLFDCANAAILEVSQKYLIAFSPGQTSWVHNKKPQGGDAASGEVWGLLNHLFSVEEMQRSSGTNNASEVVYRALQEVGGLHWTLSMRLEAEEISKEISGEILKDLVEETITCR